MQKDSVEEIAPPLGIAQQKPLLDQIPAMRPEVRWIGKDSGEVS